jgi:hypothetical protein
VISGVRNILPINPFWFNNLSLICIKYFKI